MMHPMQVQFVPDSDQVLAIAEWGALSIYDLRESTKSYASRIETVS